MSGNNIARKIQRFLLRSGKIDQVEYDRFRRRVPERPGFKLHPTKGFRRDLESAALLALLALALGACQSPTSISASPAQDVLASPVAPELKPLQTTVVQGLQDADFNLHSAVQVGALAPDDPASACLDSVLADLGLGPQSTPGPSFVPKVSDLISAGSVLYIRARQAEALAAKGGPQFSLPCKALVGQFVIDAGRAAAKAGAGALPGLGVLSGLGG